MIYLVVEQNSRRWEPLLATTDKSIAIDYAHELFLQNREVDIWESYDHCKPKLLDSREWTKSLEN
jgi:hypothetical protein